MASRKKTEKSGAQGSITVGNINNSTGVAIGHSKAVVNQTNSGTDDQIAQAFSKIFEKINQMPEGPEKNIAQNAVKGLEIEAQKGEHTDEYSVSKWFNFLAQIAPDVCEVALDTFLNPIKGLSTAFKKIAERTKAEQKGN